MRVTVVSAFGFVFGLVTLFAASPAASLSSIDLLWRSTGATHVNPSTVTVETLTAEVILRVDDGAADVFGVFVSFDIFGIVGEPGLKKLNTVGGHEDDTPGFGFMPLIKGYTVTDSGANTLVEFFDTGSLTGGLSGPGAVTLGTIVFQTNPANIGLGNGDQVVVRAFVAQNGFDAITDTSGNRCIGDSSRNDCPYTFGELTVPEPTTSALLVLGLGIGAFYSRRR